jgi:hypothetical protein
VYDPKEPQNKIPSLAIFLVLIVVALVTTFVMMALTRGQPKAHCKDGMCDWSHLTYQQCEKLCRPVQVKSYDPTGYWMNGRPTSRYHSQACLCAP